MVLVAVVARKMSKTRSKCKKSTRLPSMTNKSPKPTPYTSCSWPQVQPYMLRRMIHPSSSGVCTSALCRTIELDILCGEACTAFVIYAYNCSLVEMSPEFRTKILSEYSKDPWWKRIIKQLDENEKLKNAARLPFVKDLPITRAETQHSSIILPTAITRATASVALTFDTWSMRKLREWAPWLAFVVFYLCSDDTSGKNAFLILCDQISSI